VRERRRGGGKGAPETGAGDAVERWARVFVEDSMLWPALACVVGTFAAFGAALLVLAFEDRNLAALAALALLLAIGAQAGVRALRRRRLGVLGRIALAVAALSVLGALADHLFLER